MERCTQDMKLQTMPEDESRRLAEFFKVFADADRIRIMALLKGKEVCVGHIASALGKSTSAVSHQLSIMRNQRLVCYFKDGKNTYYTLDDDHISSLLETAQRHCSHR